MAAAVYTEHASLEAFNTFRVVARCACLAEVTDPAGIAEALARPESGSGVLVLGEGSNILFTRDFPGLVLRPRLTGIEVLGRARVRVGAGENWDRFVHWTLEEGYTGLENLALIPGTVGAAPIQNIGAYGTEVEEFVTAVEAWDRERDAVVTLSRADCGFAYRDSIFRRAPDRWIVLAVVFELPRDRTVRLDYAGVREMLAGDGAAPGHRQVAAAITRLRRSKLPDPAEIGNAGSFFKNPVVEEEPALRLAERFTGMPQWPVAEGVKLSAAWLLEQAGFRGKRAGDAGFSERHALVLVNHGRATGAELLELAESAQMAVLARFGVRLEPEPRIF